MGHGDGTYVMSMSVFGTYMFSANQKFCTFISWIFCEGVNFEHGRVWKEQFLNFAELHYTLPPKKETPACSTVFSEFIMD